ncbi:hypothetical protein [Saliphagus sp. LR7]|uniref:hypothetical protein n=1 Tax=Saliphagus sp. LR7 TaxID=2282654 RepID=UPI000DF75100|nr:hypothetical protein [Saliphagus sp. LR7]
MALQEEIKEYLNESESHLDKIGDDIEDFFSELETEENAFSEEMESEAFSTYEWAPRTEVSSAQRDARDKYEQWYNAVEPVVYDYLPRRYEEFDEMHEKTLNYLNLESGFTESAPETPMERAVDIVNLIDGQKSIVMAAPNRVAAKQFNARKDISADVEADELLRARELYEDGLVREGGVIAGVALERHLMTVCETSDREVDYDPSHSIGRLAQSLYEADVILNSPMKRLKYLGGIRGDCAHPEHEPNSEDVERLLNGAEEFIRNGFEG